MPTFPFSQWVPDAADLGNPGEIQAKNVFPAATGYEPVRAFSSSTNALDERPRGAVQARNTAGTVFQYAGDAGKLYQNVDGVWTDRSIAGGYSTGINERWEFAAWENKILATNFSDDPQQLTFGGTEFSDLTEDFKARHIAVVRDFVVFGNTNDGTDGAVPSRVRWSAFGDETDYTVSATTGADFQDLRNAAVERVLGGEFGIILQADSIWRMSFVGSPTWFQFDEVSPGIGVIAPGAAAQSGTSVFFLSEQGFFELEQGVRARPIGVGRVDRFVLNDIKQDNLDRIYSVSDPTSQRIFWAYPGSGSVSGRPNRIVVYDRGLDKWSLVEEEVELIWRAGGAGVTLDGLDSIDTNLDNITASLDSSRWVGGAPEVGVFNQDFENGFFDAGVAKPAVIETKEFEFSEGARSRLNAFRALVDGGTVTAEVGTRNNQADSVSFGPALNERPSRRFPTRNNSRYHRMRFNLSEDWSDAIGMQVDREDITRAGRRG